MGRKVFLPTSKRYRHLKYEYACIQCDMMFSRKCNLSIHICKSFIFESFKRNFSTHELSAMYTKLTKGTTSMPTKRWTMNICRETFACNIVNWFVLCISSDENEGRLTTKLRRTNTRNDRRFSVSTWLLLLHFLNFCYQLH